MSKIRLIALALVAAPAFAQADVVYSNLTNSILVWSYPSSSTPEFGDKVTLAGTARNLTGITYWLAGSGSAGAMDATFRVYAVDPGSQLPGTLLSQASVSGFPFNFQNYFVPVAMPNALLPDEVFVTAQITASSVNSNGFVVTQGPQIGSTDSDFWYENQNGTWVQMGPVGNGWGNVGLSVTAVPEPASCVALALGLVAAAARRRHAKPRE
jgi:hypothetical protein